MGGRSTLATSYWTIRRALFAEVEVGATARAVSTYTGCVCTATQEAAETGLAEIPIALPSGGSGGAVGPQAGCDPPPLELELLELELPPVLELELPLVLELPLALELELPLPAVPLLLELEDEPEVLELELPEPELEVLELEPLLELELLELELELLELELEELLLLVELCPEFPWPVDPPSNIVTAMASCDGKLIPSTRPGTSRG